MVFKNKNKHRKCFHIFFKGCNLIKIYNSSECTPAWRLGSLGWSRPPAWGRGTRRQRSELGLVASSNKMFPSPGTRGQKFTIIRGIFLTGRELLWSSLVDTLALAAPLLVHQSKLQLTWSTNIQTSRDVFLWGK